MFSKKCVRLFLVFLVIALLFLSACRPRQYSAPQKEVKTTGDVKTDKYVVSALSGVKASSVVKGLNQEEKNELKTSVVKVAEDNRKFSNDVTILLQLASKSKNPAVLDAALRLKKIYSVTSMTDDLALLHEESTTGNYDERYDDTVLSAVAAVDQVGEIITEIETHLEEETEEGTTTNALLLNHLDSMTDPEDGSYTVLNEDIDVLVETTADSLAPEDTDSDGTPDLVDHDVNNDGVEEITDDTEDLNGDGVVTLNDVVTDNPETTDYNEADVDGDGILNHEDLDVENDGVVDSVANQIVQETEEAITLEGAPEPNVDVLGDTDADGVADNYDHDGDNDGTSEDLDGDHIIEQHELPAGEDFDNDGLLNGDLLETDWNGDGVEDHELEHTGEEVLGDHDGDNILDDVDTDWNGDGVNDDLTGDGLMTSDDFDINGDGEITESDVDSDADGINDFTGDAVGNEHIDWNHDGIDDHEITGNYEDLIYTPSNLDIDNDGINNFADADTEGDGISDVIDTDDDNDGTLDTEDSDSDGDGIDDRNTETGSDREAEQAISEEAEKAEPSDTDEDGTPDYQESGESDDADEDGIENKNDEYWLDPTNSKEEFKNSVQYMNYVRFSETGIAPGFVFVAPPFEVFRTMEDYKDSADYDKRAENYAVLYKSDFEKYLNEHPEVKDHMESEMQRAEFYHPEIKNDYQDFAIKNSEFGFGKELAYYYQENPGDVAAHPEAFVIPDVAAHMETMKEIHAAFEKGGLSALEGKEGFAKEIYNYLSENPSAQEHFLSETGEAYNNYEQHKEQYVAEHGQEALKEQFTQIYGTDAGENYNSYFGYGGQINPDAQHSYDLGGALGAPLSSDFKFAEGFAPPPGYTGSTDGGFHAPGGETYHVGDSGSFGGVSGGTSESAGGSYGPAPAGGDTGGGGGGESHPADSGGGGMHGMVVFTGWFIYSK